MCIDTIGKLGPAIIAVLVLFTTWRQNRWQNTVAIRAARVEDQKFRLALLERRNLAIEKVRFAGGEFFINGAVRQEAAAAVTEALRIAELVFDDAEEEAIAAFLSQIRHWQKLDRTLQRLNDRSTVDDEERRNRLVDEITDFEDELTKNLETLLVALRKAARVSSVPALTR